MSNFKLFLIPLVSIILPIYSQGTLSTLLSIKDSLTDTTHISVFAGGEVSTSFTNQSNNGNVGSGTLGLNLTNGRFDFYIFTNIGAEGDTITKEIGTSIIDPITSNSSFKSLQLEARIQDVYKVPFTNVKMGIQIPASISNAMWGQADSTGKIVQAKSAIVGSGTIGTFYARNGHMAKTEIGFLVNVGLTMRVLGGDIFSNKFNKSILGTESSFFVGPTFGATIRLGYLNVGIQATKLLDAWEGKRIEGLTFAHISGTIGMSAPIIEGKFD